jgi:hypothetical protein
VFVCMKFFTNPTDKNMCILSSNNFSYIVLKRLFFFKKENNKHHLTFVSRTDYEQLHSFHFNLFTVYDYVLSLSLCVCVCVCMYVCMYVCIYYFLSSYQIFETASSG